MITLLSLTTEQTELKTKILKELNGVTDKGKEYLTNAEYKKAWDRLVEVKKMIANWGTQTDCVYQIM